jgi:hypothetical protein
LAGPSDRLAAQLHDKVLYADAKMNRANWLTAGAAIVGVLGIGAGLWWADGAAAIVISLDITRDGFVNVRAAIADLMDSRPSRYDSSMTHPLIGDLEEELRKFGWVKHARVRLRETGHVFVTRPSSYQPTTPTPWPRWRMPPSGFGRSTGGSRRSSSPSSASSTPGRPAASLARRLAETIRATGQERTGAA